MNQKLVITANTLGLTEEHPHHFAIEASMLGLKPGVWPSTMETSLGNGLPLIKMYEHKHGEDVTHYTYCQANGVVQVEVFND